MDKPKDCCSNCDCYRSKHKKNGECTSVRKLKYTPGGHMICLCKEWQEPREIN